MKRKLNKQGFTLIELLAVIVILAVIALIATPIIIGIIEDSKTKAQENSAYGIIDSAKYYYTQNLLKPENTIKYNENIVDNLTYNGEKPKAGSWVSVDKQGNVGIALLYGNKCYIKEYTENKLRDGNKDNCKITIPSFEPLLNDILLKPENIVTTGSGLYKTSDTEYRYRGGCNLNSSNNCTDADPIYNYIKIGQYSYRIIGTDSHGIKVISTAKLLDKAFDPNNTNIFDISDSNSNNIGYYLNKDGAALDEIKYIRTMAVDTTYTLGGAFAYVDGVKANLSQLLEMEKSNPSSDIITKIGLMYPSDYVQASLDASCQNSFNSSSCRLSNWLYTNTGSWTWTITSMNTNSTHPWYIYTSGELNTNNAINIRIIRPVFYLSLDTLYQDGNGTKENPYIIQ